MVDEEATIQALVNMARRKQIERESNLGGGRHHQEGALHRRQARAQGHALNVSLRLPQLPDLPEDWQLTELRCHGLQVMGSKPGPSCVQHPDHRYRWTGRKPGGSRMRSG